MYVVVNASALAAWPLWDGLFRARATVPNQISRLIFLHQRIFPAGFFLASIEAITISVA